VPIGTTEQPADDDGPVRRSPTAAPATSSPAVPTVVPVEATEQPGEPEVPEVPSTVINLADTDAGTAMFGKETVLVPGVISDRCIEVDYSGNIDPQPVRLYAAAAIGDLAPYLDLTIDIGGAASGAFGDCATFVPSGRLYSGTLDDFAATHSGYFSGLETWDPAEENETRTFRFTVSVQDSPLAEGRTVGFGFSWETRDLT